MPRNADRIIGHLIGQRGSTLSAMSTSSASRRAYRSSVYIYRPGYRQTTHFGDHIISADTVSSSGGSINQQSRRIPITLTHPRRDSRVSRLSSILDYDENDDELNRRTSEINGATGDTHLATFDEFDGIETASFNSSRHVSIQEGREGNLEIIVDNEEPLIFTVFENLDGVRHLFSDSRATRYTWTFLIALFVCLCFYQITTQVLMFWFTPIATNIAATYPRSVPFPVVAICNNNQYRLTYLTGDFVQNRVSKFQAANGNNRSTNVFDKALLQTWDLPAMKFLQSAGHSRHRMILKCQWPNGTRCRPADFKPMWTLNGLCYVINTDFYNPVHVTGGGLGNALKLLLNVERYERIESCTPNFRTTSLPGIKILIFNQSEVPTSNLEGVNIPPGYTMDIPFRVQQRQKLPGKDCVDEPLNADGSLLAFDAPQNARTCIIRTYLRKIERDCKCSLRNAFNGSTEGTGLPSCTVISYFSCAVKVLQQAYENGFRLFDCLPTCKQTDYTAWQDMNELPNNIFPKLIHSNANENHQNDENNIEQDNEDNDIADNEPNVEEEHFKCELNQILDAQQIERIKRDAQNAYEKQARFQEDILLRTERLIKRLRQTVERLRELKWGWMNEYFVGVQERLQQQVFCYGNVITKNEDILDAIRNLQVMSDKRRARKIYVFLLAEYQSSDQNARELEKNFSASVTLDDLRRLFGEKVDVALRNSTQVENLLRSTLSIFDAATFAHKLPRDLDRMERMLQWIDAYERGQLKRRSWAEKMQSRNVKHLFDEEFYESWYNVIVKDLDVSVLDTISQIEEHFGENRVTLDEQRLRIGSVILFANVSQPHLSAFRRFVDESSQCLRHDVRNESRRLLAEFKEAMHNFQAAYENLFRKELPEYLKNFEFDAKFVRENFAQVNVFLHKMNVEHWIQEPTYSIYSLFCDVGGSLGLFLNASLLTIIEIAYFIFDSKIYKKLFRLCRCVASPTSKSLPNSKIKQENTERDNNNNSTT